MSKEVWVCASCKKKNDNASDKCCSRCHTFREDLIITREEAETIYQEFEPALEEARLDMGTFIFSSPLKTLSHSASISDSFFFDF